MKFKMSNEPVSIFQYSSLTDIIFLLLIFFLLTSQFIISTSVKVKLPGAKSMEQSTPSRMIVTITEGGGIFFENAPVGIDLLPAKLNAFKAANNQDNLVIRSDKSVPLETVIQVLDAAKGIGIEKFVIETEKKNI
ncbi:MAG TPA: biopolymer transporter ExbD [Ignavibacteriaceae bacterium]|nr:biopolymer transporter ExbD [Ignavibacteriaceae bacterium]